MKTSYTFHLKIKKIWKYRGRYEGVEKNMLLLKTIKIKTSIRMHC